MAAPQGRIGREGGRAGSALRRAIRAGDYPRRPPIWHNSFLATWPSGALSSSVRPGPISAVWSAFPRRPITRRKLRDFREKTTTVAVKIKLKRMGKIREPYYRIVVADARTKRDGRAIEEIGRYNPKAEPSLIEVDSARAQHWLSVGAQPTDPVRHLLSITGDWQKFKGESGTEGTLKVAEPKAGKKDRYDALVKESQAAKETKAAKRDSASGAGTSSRGGRGKKADSADKPAEEAAEESAGSAGKQAKAKADPKAEAKAETKADAKTEPKAEAKTEAKAEAAEPKTEAAQAKGKAEAAEEPATGDGETGA
jgi:small subunit ribosomal protein S16